MLIFFVYPLCMTIYYSLTKFDLSNPPVWNNFKNWTYMFTKDTKIWGAAGNTLWFMAIMVPARIIGALFIAFVLTRARRTAGILRTIYYLPALIPPVASTLCFVYLLNPNGPITDIFNKFGLTPPGWFWDPNWAKPSLTFLSLWVLGDIMVIFLASLLDAPTEQYEASELDGANGFQRFWYITIPHIGPVLLFSVITGIIAALKYFDQPAVASSAAQGKATVGAGAATTMGWPDGSTLTYPQLLYAKAFGYNQLGYASAMAVLLFVVSGVLMFFLLRKFRAFTPESAQ